MTQRSPRLAGLLCRARRRVRVTACARAVGWWWGLGIGVCGALMVIDAASALPRLVRALGVVIGGILVLCGVMMALRHAVRRWTEDEDGALLGRVEAAAGIEASVLRNAHEYARSCDAAGVRRALAERAITRSEAAIAGAAPVRLPGGWGAARGRVALLIAVLLCVSAYAGLRTGEFVRTGLRLVDPFGDHPPVSPTRVVIAVDQERVLAGDAVALRVVCEGRVPDRAWVVVREDGASEGVPIELRAADAENMVWSGMIGPLTRDVHLRAHTPSGYSRAITVRPEMLARIVGVEIEMLAPDHARSLVPAQTVESPVLAVAGSVLRTRLFTSIPASRAIDEEGRTVGEGGGDAVIIERGVSAEPGEALWSFAPVTEAGEGPESVVVRVRTVADMPATVRFVTDHTGEMTVVEGRDVVVGVEVFDDVAIDPDGVSIGLGAGASLPGQRVWLDHRAMRAVVRVDTASLGNVAGDVLVLDVSARDTVPGRAATVERLEILVITDEEERARRLAKLDIDRVASPVERASQLLREALESGASEAEVREALDTLAEEDPLTRFGEAAGERAEELAEALDDEGLGERLALEAERVLAAPAERLRNADALREAAEALTRLTDDQAALAEALGGRDEGFDAFAGDQAVYAERLMRILALLDAGAEVALTAPMHAERLRMLRAIVERARGAAEREAIRLGGAPGAGYREQRIADLARTDLHFATTPLLDDALRPVPLDTACDDALDAITRIDAITLSAPDAAALVDQLAILGEAVLAIQREAQAPLPTMGASAVLIAARVREMDVQGVMDDAARLLGEESVRGAERAGRAAAMLLSLREAVEEDESEESSEGSLPGDAPLSLTPSGEQRANSSSTGGMDEGGGGPVDALTQLSANREARAAEGGAVAPAGGDATGEGGGGAGAIEGGRSVSGATAGSDAGPAPERGNGVRAWVVEETLELTPGEAVRLSRVPERYRAIVAAYLRRHTDESESDGVGRIENQ